MPKMLARHAFPPFLMRHCAQTQQQISRRSRTRHAFHMVHGLCYCEQRMNNQSHFRLDHHQSRPIFVPCHISNETLDAGLINQQAHPSNPQRVFRFEEGFSTNMSSSCGQRSGRQATHIRIRTKLSRQHAPRITTSH